MNPQDKRMFHTKRAGMLLLTLSCLAFGSTSVQAASITLAPSTSSDTPSASTPQTVSPATSGQTITVTPVTGNSTGVITVTPDMANQTTAAPSIPTTSLPASTISPTTTVTPDPQVTTGSPTAGTLVDPVTTTTTAAPASTGTYIFPESSSRMLNWDDIGNLDDWHITLGRNEIYAKHGRKFNTPEIQAYFNSCSWYSGTIEPAVFDQAEWTYLSDQELLNIAFLEYYQNNPSCKGQELTISLEKPVTSTAPASTTSAIPYSTPSSVTPSTVTPSSSTPTVNAVPITTP